MKLIMMIDLVAVWTVHCAPSNNFRSALSPWRDYAMRSELATA